MQRTELLATLRRLKPAVLGDQDVQALSSVYFSDGYIYAFNDELGIRIEAGVEDLELGVDYKLLTTWLAGIRGAEVTWQQTDKGWEQKA